MLFAFLKKSLRSPYLIIALIVVLAYWPVAFLKFSLQWDMLDVHLPFLYYLSECLQNNEFPFWNPYLQMGYPFHADLQATPYYPPALLIARFIGFNLYTLHFYFLAHVILAGLGMYRLCKNLAVSEFASLICGICYALGGIFISNGQHLLIITGAAIFPMALSQYFLLYKSPRLFHAVLLSLIWFLMFSGGYPFISIIFFYLVLVLFFVFTIKLFSEKKFPALIKFGILNILSAFFCLALCSPIIISLKEVLPEVSRGAGISAEYALNNPYTIKAFLYFLLPFSLIKNIDFFGTDLSMTNIYFGLIPFCFFIYSLTQKKSKAELFFLFAGICCLLFSFGQDLPFRKWLYDYVPMMNYFRFPAIFRIFSVVSFLVIAGFGITKFLLDREVVRRKKMIYIIGFVSLYFVGQIINSFHEFDFETISFNKQHDSFKGMLSDSTFSEHVLIQAVFQLVFLSFFTALILGDFRKYFTKIVFLLIASDMVLSAQMNLPYTVVEPLLNPTEIYEGIQAMPRGFSIPRRADMSMAADERIGIKGIWRNVNVFSKEPATDAFSSFWLINHEKLFEAHPLLAHEIIKNPPVYLSSKFFSEKELGQKTAEKSISSKDLFFDERFLPFLNSQKFETSNYDTCYLKKFGPNDFVVQAKTGGAQILTLLQNNYKGWEVFIDDQKAEHFTSNIMFISVIIPGGEHLVLFKYRNNLIINAFIFSSVLFILLIISLLFIRCRKF